MSLLLILRIVLCLWLALLIIQSISNNAISLVLISGTIITSMPLVLLLAWTTGLQVFRAVFLFSLFVIVVIALQVMQLIFG